MNTSEVGRVRFVRAVFPMLERNQANKRELFAIKTFQAYQNDCEYFFLTTESHRFNDSDRPDT